MTVDPSLPRSPGPAAAPGSPRPTGPRACRARIGVLADTHVPVKARALPARVLRAFEGVDLILHAGDLIDARVIEDLSRIAPVEAVAGNNDPRDLADRLGWRKVLEVAGVRIGLVHGHRGRGRNTPDRAAHAFAREPDIAAVVFGHSHLPLLAPPGARAHAKSPPLPFFLFNPGSPTDRRHAPRCSFGTLWVEEDGSVRAEHTFL